MPATYNNGNSSNSYTVPDNISLLTLIVHGAVGGDGGDGAGQDGRSGGVGGRGGYVKGELSVTPGETFTINIGGGGLPGENGEIADSVSAAQGGSAGQSPDNDGGAGSESQVDPDMSGTGGAGGGGAAETRAIRDADGATLARSEGGGGGGGGITDDGEDSAFAGGGGGGARGGSGGVGANDNRVGQDAEGTGDGGNGGDGNLDGSDGGQQVHSDLTNVTTTTGGSTATDDAIIRVYEKIYWSTPGVTLSVEDDDVTVSYNNAKAASRYDIHRSTTSGFTPTSSTRVGSVNGSTLQFTDTSPQRGETYYYKVIAENNEYSQTSGEVSTKIRYKVDVKNDTQFDEHPIKFYDGTNFVEPASAKNLQDDGTWRKF